MSKSADKVRLKPTFGQYKLLKIKPVATVMFTANRIR